MLHPPRTIEAPPRPTIAAAAPAWVRDRLAGPIREVPVIHAGTNAIYLDVGGSCIGVLSSSAANVPCGLHTTLATLADLLTGEPTAAIGADLLRIGGTDIAVGRLLDLGVPRVAMSSPNVSYLLRSYGVRVADVLSEVPPIAVAALGDDDALAVPELLGRGPGLTPLGDDVLAGWLAARKATGRRSVLVAAAVDALAADRTTLLSATLLRRACAGDLCFALRRLLLALGGSPAMEVDSAAAELLAVGHSSGAGMLLGVHLGLTPPGESR